MKDLIQAYTVSPIIMEQTREYFSKGLKTPNKIYDGELAGGVTIEKKQKRFESAFNASNEIESFNDLFLSKHNKKPTDYYDFFNIAIALHERDYKFDRNVASSKFYTAEAIYKAHFRQVKHVYAGVIKINGLQEDYWHFFCLIGEEFPKQSISITHHKNDNTSSSGIVIDGFFNIRTPLYFYEHQLTAVAAKWETQNKCIARGDVATKLIRPKDYVNHLIMQEVIFFRNESPFFRLDFEDPLMDQLDKPFPDSAENW